MRHLPCSSAGSALSDASLDIFMSANLPVCLQSQAVHSHARYCVSSKSGGDIGYVVSRKSGAFITLLDSFKVTLAIHYRNRSATASGLWEILPAK